MSNIHTIGLTRSQLAEVFLRIRGKPVDFSLYPHSKYVLDTAWDNVLIKWGRQSGKSMTICFGMLLDSKFDNYNQVYITPLQSQVKAFSVLKFRGLLRGSKSIWNKFYSPSDKSGIDNIFSKVFENGTYVIFSYASDDPDRLRSYTFDRIIMDEIQDIDVKTVSPVIEACTFQSTRNEILYLGTPKSLDNDIELLWENSTQHEWTVKCDSCNNYNIFISLKTIGKDGPICAKCGSPLNPLTGTFVPMNPSGKMTGFHFSRTSIVFSQDQEVNKKKWHSQVVGLLEKPEWTEAKFYNEVLGVSYGKGVRVLERKDLLPLQILDPIPLSQISSAPFKAIGIDWGGSDYTHKLDKDIQSQTALVVLCPYHNKYGVFFYEKFISGPKSEIGEIIKIIREVKPNVVFADAGGGLVQNAELTEMCREMGIVFSPVRWGTPKKVMDYAGYFYSVHKTAIFDAIMIEFLRGNILLPKNSEKLIEEILAEHSETTDGGNKVWKRVRGRMDDLLHALSFAWIGLKMVTGDKLLPTGTRLDGEVKE